MVEVDRYNLPPTALVPNSPLPLLHYKQVFPDPASRKPAALHELYHKNGWKTQWIFRYGPTQDSHYHSVAHECMTVLSGTARIRFGVADTSPDWEASTHGDAKEDGGIEIDARAGDVFILPAGTAHKTMSTTEGSEFALLTPGGGHDISGDYEASREALSKVEPSGYSMMGSYPDGYEWDSHKGGEDVGNFHKIWAVPKPQSDPVLGKSTEGIIGQWHT